MRASHSLRSSNPWPATLAGLACAALLAACGGGGGDASPTAAADVAQGGTTGTTTGTSTTGGTGTTTTGSTGSTGTTGSTSSGISSSATDGTCGLSGFQAEVLRLLNERRAAGASCGTTAYAATAALTWNDKLTQAAAGHSQDMAQRNYFSHSTPEGGTLAQRIDAVGYSWSIAGENIAAGQTTVARVVADLMASPSHCANIMSASFKDVGVACMPGTATSQYAAYWTMDFGAPR